MEFQRSYLNLGIMTKCLLPSRPSISFLVVSVGSIFLSIMIASVVVSYNPTILNLNINGYFRGIGYLKQPSFDYVNGNRSKDYEFSAGSEVPNSSAFSPTSSVDMVSNNLAFAPILSFDEVPNSLAFTPTISLDEVSNSSAFASTLSLDKVSNTSAFSPTLSFNEVSNSSAFASTLSLDKVSNTSAFSPTLSFNEVLNSSTFAPTLSFDEVSNGLAFAPALSLDKVSTTSAFAPTLSLDKVSNSSAFASTLSLDELQEVENSNSSGSAYGDDNKEPDMLDSAVFVDDSEINGSEIGSGIVALLNKTASAAALPSPPSEDYEKLSSCDLYHGKWIYDPAGPLYTNNTCPILAQAQNCQGNGRPDKSYENWRWKPNQCELPHFDAMKFLELMRGKTLAFVGDSLARNQMESLLCILWQTEIPINHGNRLMHKWYFQSTSTTIVRIWSSWLVRKTPLPVPLPSPRSVKVHLDVPDESFMNFLPNFDVVVLSSGHWFTKESTYLLNGTTITRKQLKHRKRSRKKQRFYNIEVYSIALQTILNAIANLPNYKGLTIFRSYSPEHYEGGEWNMGGSCVGFDKLSSRSVRSVHANVMQKNQVEEFEKAKKKVWNGSKFVYMDITEMSGYRHDHPSRYRSKVHNEDRTEPEDCTHWCMPGPVDLWNEILFEIIRRDVQK